MRGGIQSIMREAPKTSSQVQNGLGQRKKETEMKAKKLVWASLLAGLLIALCAVAAYGASYTAPEGVYYYDLIANGTQAEITYAEVTGDVTIPTTLGGKPVTRIGEGAFYCDISSVVIPKGVTVLGDGAFAECPRLVSVKLPASLKTIGSYAFYYCSSLSSVPLPAGLQTIGQEAFGDCARLNNVAVPASVTSIGKGAFSYCPSLKNFSVSADNKKYSTVDGVLFNKEKTTLLQFIAPGKSSYTIPATVKTLAANAFAGNGGLKKVTLSSGMTSVAREAFAFCTALESVTMPNSIKSIGESAFWGCENLKSVSLSNQLTSIGNAAFLFCISLRSIELPDTLTTIGESAFVGAGLTKVTIPAEVSNIREDAFCGCPNLASFSVSADNKKFASQDGVLFNKAKTTLLQYPANNARQFYTIPSGVKTIGECSFCNHSLKALTVPKSVTRIGKTAFDDSAPFKIACYKNSAAHKYALANDVPIILLDTHTHSFSAWKTTKAATCKAAGTQTRSCTVCGAAESKTLAQLTTHKAGAWKVTVKPTATAQGKQTQSCTVCGKVLATKAVPATHTVKLNLTKITLGKTESYTLKATTSVKTTVKWKSSDAKVATVDSNGKIKAVGTGSATITVTTAGGRTATCVVTVKAAPASVKLSKSTLALAKGKTETLTATLNPGGAASYAKSWTSSDTKVAKVDANGKITAIGKGTATITYKVFNGQKATCKVTVK